MFCNAYIQRVAPAAGQTLSTGLSLRKKPEYLPLGPADDDE